MQPGGAFPQACVAAPCSRNASLPRHVKSLALAGAHGRPGIVEIAQQARRLFGGRMYGSWMTKGSGAF